MYKDSFNTQFTIVYLNVVSVVSSIFESKNYFNLILYPEFSGFL